MLFRSIQDKYLAYLTIGLQKKDLKVYKKAAISRKRRGITGINAKKTIYALL